MLATLRALARAGNIPALLGALGLALLAFPLAAQGPGTLGFLGFTPGATTAELRAAFLANRGSGWSCRDAREATSVSECRGTLLDPVHQEPVVLWASVIGGHAGILTLRADLGAPALEEWRRALVDSYGPAPQQRRGPIRMMQWVRGGRMLRLTWHPSPGTMEVSVSLVDGPVLDAWGRPRSGG